MKKNIFYIIILLFSFSCQEVIEVDITDAEPRLVIDAYFNILKDNNGTTINNEGGVLLSLSAPYFDDAVKKVSNATIYITNLTDNTIINFIESSTPGFFIPNTTTSFQPNFNIDYELTVVYNNETYTSTTQYIPTVPIEKLEQGDGVLFEGNEQEVIIYYTDDGTRDDFYMFDLDFNLFLPTDDNLYQGQAFNFSYFYSVDDTMFDKEIIIKILGITEDYHDYFNLILEQDPDDGNPFSTVPALFKGNIVNTTNSDNFPFGFFRISEAYSKTIIIEED